MQFSAKLVVGLSLVATAATVANALVLHKQFFPSMLYITKSSASMAVVYFQGIMIVFMIFQLLKRLFFGELRAAETEHLSERAWHAVLETCLAFTVFRDDFSPTFVMQFVLLLFFKCFHWLADDRVDVMERSPLITLKFHIRMLSVIGAMAAVDSYLVSHAYFSIILKGASSQIVFGFEYAILITMVIHVAIKYILHMHDLRTAQNWEAKTVYLLYAELVMNAARCILYGLFALVMMRIHTFPLFSIRPFYLSVKAVHKAFRDVYLSRQAIAAMNTMFPVVNEAELANIDSTCIICREEMVAESQPKRLPCSHVFHAHCLRSWFQRQQTCPTCRTDILGGRNNNNREQAPQQAQAAPGPVPQFIPVPHPFAFQAVPPNPNFEAADAARMDGDIPMPDMNMFGFNMPNPPHVIHGQFPMPPFGLAPPVAPRLHLPNPQEIPGLSDEELRMVEGNHRDAIINRLQMLRDITTLLDAADLMMQQYMQATNAGVHNFTSPRPTNLERPDQGQADRAGEATTVPSTSGLNDQSEEEDEDEEAHPSTSRPTLFGSMSTGESAAPHDDENTISHTDSTEELRQRRLRRFVQEDS